MNCEMFPIIVYYNVLNVICSEINSHCLNQYVVSYFSLGHQMLLSTFFFSPDQELKSKFQQRCHWKGSRSTRTICIGKMRHILSLRISRDPITVNFASVGKYGSAKINDLRWPSEGQNAMSPESDVVIFRHKSYMTPPFQSIEQVNPRRAGTPKLRGPPGRGGGG